MRIDCEDFPPLVKPLGEQTYMPGNRDGDTYTLVKAADLRTYRYLSGYWWREYTGQTSVSRHGTHYETSFGPNTSAYAFVEPDELITTNRTLTAEATARINNPGITPEPAP